MVELGRVSKKLHLVPQQFPQKVRLAPHARARVCVCLLYPHSSFNAQLLIPVFRLGLSWHPFTFLEERALARGLAMWVRRGHQKLLGGVRDKDFLELAFEVICSRGRGDGIEVKEELGQFPDITLAPIKRLPHGSLRYKAIKRGITIDAEGFANIVDVELVKPHQIGDVGKAAASITAAA